MKAKIFYLILMAMTLSLTFAACDKDDDDDNNGEASGGSIVGRWTYSDLKIVDLKVNNQPVSSTQLKQLENELRKEFDGDDMLFGGVIEFTSDGKAYAFDGSSYATYAIKGNNLTITEGDELISLAYSVTGNQLQLNMDMFQLADADDLKELQSVGITAYAVGFIFVRDDKKSASLKSRLQQPTLKNVVQRLVKAVN
jgi:hypothetical protein